jgi:ribosomal protein L20A (L18A)
MTQATGLDEEQIERVYAAIGSKRKVAHYLHAPAMPVVE